MTTFLHMRKTVTVKTGGEGSDRAETGEEYVRDALCHQTCLKSAQWQW